MDGFLLRGISITVEASGFTCTSNFAIATYSWAVRLVSNLIPRAL